MDLTNTAYTNSKIQVQLQLVHTEEISRAENDTRNLLWLKHDPYVNRLQATFRAPFAALVVENLAGGCGVGSTTPRGTGKRRGRSSW